MFYLLLGLLTATTLGIALYGVRISANPGVLIVDPRGPPHGTHSSISEALADALDDDIIWVRNGTYYEHLVVNKSVTIKWDYITYDPALPSHRAIVDGSEIGVVFNVTASNVAIFNLTIQNGREGIHLVSTAVNTSIISNLAVLNTQYGIYVDSANNIIKENMLTDNGFGMHVDSGGNFLRNNVMLNNTHNFGIENFTNNDIDPSNTVNGKPIHIWIDKHYTQVPPNAGYVALVNSTNIAVEDLKLSNNDYGIRLINTVNSTIANVEASHNKRYGVYLFNAENISVQNVNASYNHETGIYLHYSKNNLIGGNGVSHNDMSGIDLDYSDSNTISDNIISYNYGGIQLIYSESNGVIRNKICYNEWMNIVAQDSSNNKFYHNNIEHGEPARQTWYLDSYDLWDNSAEGNYWSDYNVTYPDVVDANGDGIWDHPYEINAHNYDPNPLVRPWKSVRLFNVAKTVPYNRFKGYNITVHSDHVIASLNFSRIGEDIYPRLLSFNVTAGSSGFWNITIPRAWLDGPFRLWINDNPRTFLLKQNASHSSLCFMYATAVQHQVRILAVKSGGVLGDLNEDGKIDIKDVASVAILFGEYLPADLTPKDITQYDP